MLLRTATRAALICSLTACGHDATQPDVTPIDVATAADVNVSTDIASTDASTVPDVTVDTMAADVPPMCPVGADAQAGETCVLNVHGSVRDLEGSPVGNQLVTVCGSECFFGRSDATGAFLVTPASLLPWGQYVVAIHGRPDHASSYVPLTMPMMGEVAYASPLLVPRYTDTGGLIPDPAVGGSVTAGDVTLTVDAGTVLQFDIEDAELGTLGHSLRSAFVPLASAPPFASEGHATQVHALAPFDLVADRPMGVRVANRAGFAAGAAVDFVVMGVEFFMDPINAGHAVVAATGHVSSDGTTVSTDAGQGIRVVTWLGIRLAGG